MTNPPLIRKRRLLLILIGVLVWCACGQNRTLDRIKESGTITLITRNNAHCYYIYRGQEMGFEYELAKGYADFLGLGLSVKVCKSWSELLAALDKGEGDFVAAGVTIIPSRLEVADFSKEYLSVQQMVITHKDNSQVNCFEDLQGKTVHIQGGTAHEEALKKLRGDRLDISIELHPDLSTEEIIEDVARGKAEITVAYSNVALLNRRYCPDIRIALPIGKPQSLGWAVKKGERALLGKINAFFEKIKQDGTFEDIYKRYYACVEKFDHLDITKFKQRIQARLPRYERVIKKASEKHGFDWRLIAALIYQESQFNPRARSFTGVRGLMQLTMPTAQEMGIENRLDPEQSILGGVKYLRKLYDLYDVAEGQDRLFLSLAAYNVGNGHVMDARGLALNMKLDPNKWSSLEKTLPLLSKARYYKKSQFGYCRGAEPVFHVQSILTYYDILKREAIEYAINDR
jgi:membrane-bound lytic murein transglycosylase F